MIKENISTKKELFEFIKSLNIPRDSDLCKINGDISTLSFHRALLNNGTYILISKFKNDYIILTYNGQESPLSYFLKLSKTQHYSSSLFENIIENKNLGTLVFSKKIRSPSHLIIEGLEDLVNFSKGTIKYYKDSNLGRIADNNLTVDVLFPSLNIPEENTESKNCFINEIPNPLKEELLIEEKELKENNPFEISENLLNFLKKVFGSSCSIDSKSFDLLNQKEKYKINLYESFEDFLESLKELNKDYGELFFKKLVYSCFYLENNRLFLNKSIDTGSIEYGLEIKGDKINNIGYLKNIRAIVINYFIKNQQIEIKEICNIQIKKEEEILNKQKESIEKRKTDRLQSNLNEWKQYLSTFNLKSNFSQESLIEDINKFTDTTLITGTDWFCLIDEKNKLILREKTRYDFNLINNRFIVSGNSWIDIRNGFDFTFSDLSHIKRHPSVEILTTSIKNDLFIIHAWGEYILLKLTPSGYTSPFSSNCKHLSFLGNKVLVKERINGHYRLYDVHNLNLTPFKSVEEIKKANPQSSNSIKIDENYSRDGNETPPVFLNIEDSISICYHRGRDDEKELLKKVKERLEGNIFNFENIILKKMWKNIDDCDYYKLISKDSEILLNGIKNGIFTIPLNEYLGIEVRKEFSNDLNKDEIKEFREIQTEEKFLRHLNYHGIVINLREIQTGDLNQNTFPLTSYLNGINLNKVFETIIEENIKEFSEGDNGFKNTSFCENLLNEFEGGFSVDDTSSGDGRITSCEGEIIFRKERLWINSADGDERYQIQMQEDLELNYKELVLEKIFLKDLSETEKNQTLFEYLKTKFFQYS